MPVWSRMRIKSGDIVSNEITEILLQNRNDFHSGVFCNGVILPAVEIKQINFCFCSRSNLMNQTNRDSSHFRNRRIVGIAVVSNDLTVLFNEADGKLTIVSYFRSRSGA